MYEGSNVIGGRTGNVDPKTGEFDGLVYMACNDKNNFFPSELPTDVDVMYICNPNNPTGAAMTTDQLAQLVDHALDNKILVLYDSAYERYITDDKLPKTIYEIGGAERCAIEIGSFSKEAGFTGVRLGWSVVPKNLSVLEKKDEKDPTLNWVWNKRTCTSFNGASNIVQAGGLFVMTKEGQEKTQEYIDYYMENARIERKALESIGLTVFGAENAPYAFAKVPSGETSTSFAGKLLEKCGIVSTPGVGFGSAGEGFVRLSGYGIREDIEEAARRIEENMK